MIKLKIWSLIYFQDSETMKLMFVCTANTCRSVMAEYIFKGMVGKEIEICSAGIMATDGRSPSKNTVMACRNQGIDVTNHKATNVKRSDIEDMDLVLTLETSHRDTLRKRYPDLKIYTIKEFNGVDYLYDIDDPFMYDLEVYEATFKEIQKSLEKIDMNKLLEYEK